MSATISSSISFRPAVPTDMPWIIACVARMHLDDENLRPEQFVVAQRAGRDVGFGRIKPYREVHELGCVAVVEGARHTGVGEAIVRELVRRFPSPDVWITTDLVAYFERLGFAAVADPPRELAEKLARIEGRIRSGVVAMRLRRGAP